MLFCGSALASSDDDGDLGSSAIDFERGDSFRGAKGANVEEGGGGEGGGGGEHRGEATGAGALLTCGGAGGFVLHGLAVEVTAEALTSSFKESSLRFAPTAPRLRSTAVVS